MVPVASAPGETDFDNFTSLGCASLSRLKGIGFTLLPQFYGFPGGTSGKETSANAGEAGDMGSIPGRSFGKPFQYSCLENPMDRGAWWATVHRIAELDKTEATWHAPITPVLW